MLMGRMGGESACRDGGVLLGGGEGRERIAGKTRDEKRKMLTRMARHMTSYEVDVNDKRQGSPDTRVANVKSSCFAYADIFLTEALYRG